MDVTPQLLREAEFKEQRKGYDPVEVRDFLARLADAVGRLQDELGAAVERATRAERRLLDSPAEEDELRRTLVLAQRTVDAAVEEGRQRAAEMVAEAEARAAAVTAEADERAAATTAAADERASGVVAEAEGRVATELVPLLAQREALQGDVEALRSWGADIRARMADELRQQLAWLDDGSAHLPPRPDLVAVDLPESDPGAEAAVDDARAPGRHEGDGQGGDADAGPADRDGPRRDPTAVLDLREEGDADHGAEDGALAQAAADDPFLAELRRAVTDDEPLGPRERVVVDPGGDDLHRDDVSGSTSVFRRKKRR